MAAGTTLGTAYVQIQPSATGIKGSISKVLGGESESAGTSAGLNIVKFAKKAIIGGAIGKVLKDTLMQGANLEQLKGGVEKIFDGANMSQIFADANNAYKDLNLSANEYLNTITNAGATFASTMGDQKGYDVARAGMLAVSDYATGTGKDVGLLNEKFQMISRSTSSYQSIADQFAGLLPQTSRDFLAQAQAAGFLSDEYKSLTDVPVAEYQEALVQMMQKGTESMGLAGNTALETEKTFTGSLEAMKAAAQNVLGSLALGENIQPAFSSLITAVDTFVFNNLLPMIGTIVRGLPQLIATLVQEGIPTLLERISTFVANLAESLTQKANSLTSDKVKAWAVETIPKLLQSAGELIGKFASGLVENLPKIITAIGQIALSIVTGLGQAIWPKIVEAANGIKERFLAPINALKDKVKEIIDKIKSFFSFNISLPHIPLPHFSISPSGWKLGDLLKGQLPSLGIEWYAKGGIADGATIAGIGEAGHEGIIPLDPFWKKMDEMKAGTGDININVYAAPGMDVNELAEKVQNKLIQAENRRRLAWR